MTRETTTLETGVKTKSRFRRVAGFASTAAILLAMSLGQDAATPTAATAAVASLPAPPASGELGFAVVSWHPPNYNGDDSKDCPDGNVAKLRDQYLRTLPKAEADRLTLKENENEMEARWKAYGRGPNGSNICSNVYEFLDRPPVPLMTGPVAWGIDLDNDATGTGKAPYTCAHANFTTPDGRKGVDNQIWRVFGCSTHFRGTTGDGKGADLPMGYDNAMATGERTQVIILRGVNSLANDPDVDVIYANTDDRPITDSIGNFIHKASFSVSTTGRKADFRNVLKGRIVNGVLTTDSRDIQLNRFDFARARVRLEFQTDGSAKGITGGYEEINQVTRTARGGGGGSVATAGIDCAGEFTAMRMMADGDRDPKTGRCSRISNAYAFDAVPAFITDISAPSKKISSK